MFVCQSGSFELQLETSLTPTSIIQRSYSLASTSVASFSKIFNSGDMFPFGPIVKSFSLFTFVLGHSGSYRFVSRDWSVNDVPTAKILGSFSQYLKLAVLLRADFTPIFVFLLVENLTSSTFQTFIWISASLWLFCGVLLSSIAQSDSSLVISPILCFAFFVSSSDLGSFTSTLSSASTQYVNLPHHHGVS